MKNGLYFFSLLLLVNLTLASCGTTSKRVQSSRYESSRSISKTTSNQKTNTKFSSSSSLRNSLVQEAKKYIGTKYEYGGKSPKAFDCSGFTCYVMEQKGMSIARKASYQAIQGKRLTPNKTKPGDLLFFGKKGNISHVGMVVQNDRDDLLFIHASKSKGVRIDNLNTSKYWSERIMFARNIVDTYN